MSVSFTTLWGTRRVKSVASKIGSGKTPPGGSERYVDEGTIFLRSQNVHFDGLRLDDVAYIDEATHRDMHGTRVKPDDVLLNITGASLGRVTRAPRNLGEANVNQHVCIVRPTKEVSARYLTYALASRPGQEQIFELQVGGNREGLNFEQVGNLRLPAAPLEEQHRIANFLDAETNRIDRVGEAREAQGALLSLMLGQLIDGAIAGDAETLKKLGVDTDDAGWELGKVSRLCQVIPGYAFPSEGFLRSGGTSLLRGINVSVDATSWDDTVSWDEEKTPTPQRFHLRNGDLVMGMDRPWISSGMRMTFISENDLPALLLQRVACLRPKSAEVDTGYIYWSLRSSRFRQAVEGELTGVSVPHLSGDQIGGFTFPLPPLSTQRDISERLSDHSARIRGLRSSMNRQAELLAERRQALITAAVTGQFDVSTASGRNVTEGVSV
ncbi:restriction endonuclease subunit S [Streptomyces sp. MBT97]|uniref:restriction endonuclease subunit S n=1 Tax=Streptomyces sp. MBT97 TaxID=2800411 RepID=UPI00190D613C|nr:restriction endonuclease subunit S [Streptomyces sp. MBT97]MBK3633719.1 restriction endonuclease subunit S [Streptomyces sp. MBT97]